MPTVLVVDDSKSVRVAMKSILEDNGYTAIMAENGQEALTAIEEHSPDCVVLDLLMPVMDGIETLTAIRKSGNRIRVLIMTADIQETTRDMVESLGISGFINKPVKDLTKVVDKINNILNR